MKKILYIWLLICLSMQITNAQQLTVASYNIRYNNQNDVLQGNGWKEHRCQVITDLISFNDFDIFGAQEVLHDQLEDMLTALPEYGYIGVGRDDGKTEGEYAPIFYKKDRFTVLKEGHFWLSENTGYPNKGWDAVLPRICTWTLLKDKNSKMKVWFFNLHMDHVGIKAREESAKLVLKQIREMCGKDPVILTGDFNVDQTHESYKILATSDILTDSYERAHKRYALNGTFNSFRTDLFTTSRIDHVFVSPNLFVERYGVLTDTYRTEKKAGKTIKGNDSPQEISFLEYEARVPSDHFPVKVVLTYSKKK